MKMSATFAMIKALEKSFTIKPIHSYTDDEPVKYMLSKMRASLNRPDLQILISEICKSSIPYQIHFWMHHTPGKDNKTADAISREISLSQVDSSKLVTKLQCNFVLQLASDFSSQFNV